MTFEILRIIKTKNQNVSLQTREIKILQNNIEYQYQ